MRRIAILMMLLSAFATVLCGCGWKQNLDWTEHHEPNGPCRTVSEFR